MDITGESNFLLMIKNYDWGFQDFFTDHISSYTGFVWMSNVLIQLCGNQTFNLNRTAGDYITGTSNIIDSL